MYYYGNGYGAAPVAGAYPYAPVYGGQNNTSLWAIILVIFILFVIIGCAVFGLVTSLIMERRAK